MPFLRVLRDKRGYETTYLIHWYREGNRQRSRILYVFRTLGGVRVGREPFEPEVLRNLEAQHPAVVFDWKAIMADRQVVETGPEPRRTRKPRRIGDERASAVSPRRGVRSVEPAAPTAPARPSIPAALEGSTPDAQIEFLALWYPIVRDRIPQRTSDAARREALLALAERLNPAAWTDADEIAAGLHTAAESLDRLSHVFSRRRRRSKRATTRPVASASTVSDVEPSDSQEAPAPAEDVSPAVSDIPFAGE